MIEVLAAVLLTSIVIGVAVAFQINLGTSMNMSRERLRTERQVVALLDRIARDLMGAYFIVPAEGGNQSRHPWIFLASRQFADAEAEAPSDALKFVTRNHQSQGLDTHSSDLAVVAYFLNPMPDAPAYELLRWRSTHMPMEYDPSFPDPDDPDAQIMGEGILKFAITMIDQAGVETPFWDSVRAGSRRGLPNAVRLDLAIADPSKLEEATLEQDDGGFGRDIEFEPPFDVDEENLKTFSKLIVLPLKPLDWSFLESEVNAAAGLNGETDDMDGDGIPDSEDDDIDGDGIPNEEDSENIVEEADFDAFDDEDRDPFGFGDEDEDEEYDDDDFRF